MTETLLSWDERHYLAVVKEFGEVMVEQLKANRDKGTTWTDMSPSWLLRRLRAEVNELARAVKSRNADRIAQEAADVANFAMFLADKLRAAPPTENG